MDTSTHEVRLANWKSIVEQCAARPEGQTVKQWLVINGINEKQYYYWQRKVRRAAVGQIANTQLPVLRQRSEVALAEIRFETESESLPKQSFIPAAVIRTERATIEISAFASPALTSRILKAVSHAV